MAEFMQIDHDTLNNMNSIERLREFEMVPDIDITLSHYISNHRGFAYYNRLIFIALQHPNLRAEALKLAVNYIKENTYDTISYSKIFEILLHTALVNIAPNDEMNENTEINANVSSAVMSGANIAGLVYDTLWIENARRTSAFKLEQLDTDLKNYQANSIKENVRRVSDDLGHLYLQMGNLDKSLKCFVRSRENSTSSFQELISCINIVRVYIYQEAWPFVNANFAKADSLIDAKDSLISRAEPETTSSKVLSTNTTQNNNLSVLMNKESYAIAKSQLAIAGGLYQLTLGKYRSAAMYFIQVSGDYQDSYNDIASTQNIVHYGSLCALASMDRSEIGKLISGNNKSSKQYQGTIPPTTANNFRQLLETEPVCRDILKSFYSADYLTCLRKLEKLCRTNLCLDCYLSNHIVRLVGEIRSKTICQYFSPYISADISSMAQHLDTTPALLQEELSDLIQKGKLRARIDSAESLLKSLNVDQRKHSFTSVLKQTDEFLDKIQKMLLRMALAKNHLCVEPDPSDASETPGYATSRIVKRSTNSTPVLQISSNITSDANGTLMDL